METFILGVLVGAVVVGLIIWFIHQRDMKDMSAVCDSYAANTIDAQLEVDKYKALAKEWQMRAEQVLELLLDLVIGKLELHIEKLDGKVDLADEPKQGEAPVAPPAEQTMAQAVKICQDAGLIGSDLSPDIDQS